MVGREPQGQIVLQADALKKGWGAFCQSNRTEGQWSLSFHINILKLLAIKYAIMSIVKLRKVHSFHNQVDNTTALLYLMKMGSHFIQNDKYIQRNMVFSDERNKNEITAKYLPCTG